MTEIGRAKELLDTPTLWVDLDVLDANIALLMGNFRDAGVNWRPHTKGIKIPAIAHKMIAAGALGVTCAKLGEAEVMAQAGVGDILIANQVVGFAEVRAAGRAATPRRREDRGGQHDNAGRPRRGRASRRCRDSRCSRAQCGDEPGGRYAGHGGCGRWPERSTSRMVCGWPG